MSLARDCDGFGHHFLCLLQSLLVSLTRQKASSKASRVFAIFLPMANEAFSLAGAVFIWTISALILLGLLSVRQLASIHML